MQLDGLFSILADYAADSAVEAAILDKIALNGAANNNTITTNASSDRTSAAGGAPEAITSAIASLVVLLENENIPAAIKEQLVGVIETLVDVLEQVSGDPSGPGAEVTSAGDQAVGSTDGTDATEGSGGAGSDIENTAGSGATGVPSQNEAAILSLTNSIESINALIERLIESGDASPELLEALAKVQESLATAIASLSEATDAASDVFANAIVSIGDLIEVLEEAGELPPRLLETLNSTVDALTAYAGEGAVDT